jgi:hypothetical protein
MKIKCLSKLSLHHDIIRDVRIERWRDFWEKEPFSSPRGRVGFLWSLPLRGHYSVWREIKWRPIVFGWFKYVPGTSESSRWRLGEELELLDVGGETDIPSFGTATQHCLDDNESLVDLSFYWLNLVHACYHEITMISVLIYFFILVLTT